VTSDGAAPRPHRARFRDTVARFDTATWSGCLLVMISLTALLWLIEIGNAADHHRLDRFGLVPRTIHGLPGVVTMPFLHANAGHLAANTFPFLLVGWVVLVSGVREFLLTTLLVVVAGGLATWVVGPSATIVGVSALVFGWLGYLISRAVFGRRLGWILVAIGMLAFFGGLFAGLLPTSHHYVAWQAHVCGFLAGGVAGWWLHPRKGTDRYLRARSGAPSR
jgi:membrane associated rhomboid family serine protease